MSGIVSGKINFPPGTVISNSVFNQIVETLPTIKCFICGLEDDGIGNKTLGICISCLLATSLLLDEREVRKKSKEIKLMGELMR